MARRRNFQQLPATAERAHIESMAHDGRGVTHIDGKAVFIEGALPGEEVMFVYRARHKRFDEGRATEIVQASAARVSPRCRHFGVCGGCSLQHMESAAQIHGKQQILLDNLKHIGDVQPGVVLPPLLGPAWGYRRKARLGAKFVIKKDALLVGFREKGTGLLADLTHCEVLHPSVGLRLPELRVLLAGLDSFMQIPQIEVAIGDTATALVFRHLVPLSEQDQHKLRAFGQDYDLQIYAQPGGPESIRLLWPDTARLSYCLPNYGLELFFLPTDFTQVNADINRQLVDRVMALLAPQNDENVLDLFCGLGNFTLPLARHAARVTGVEGEPKLVQRARDNAAHNDIGNADFHAADLNLDMSAMPWASRQYHKILLDPPRTGALEIVRQLPGFNASRIVYVSCNPSTLARDAKELVSLGYKLVSAGVMDMFPHTMHVESIGVFERTG